jgi:Interferon-induced transmembrane protein/zinc-ribbon domain
VFCTQCGTRNDDNATTCIQCGNALRPAAFGTPMTPSATPPQQQPPPPQQYQQAPIAQAYVPPTIGVQGPHVPNYLVQSILVTLCCCLPFGIVSIIFAAQVNTKLAVGNIAGAMESSRQAKLFAWIGFGIGVAGVGVYALLMVLGLVAGIAGNAH